MPDHTPHPWEHGWTADASRTPGTRRLWLAGALAIAVVTACVTALAVNSTAPRSEAAPRPPGAPTAGGPGLLSFASPSGSTTAPPKGRSGLTPVTPQTASASPQPDPSPSKSPGGQGSSPQPKPKPAPQETGTSVRSVNYPDRYWHISGDFVRLDPVGSPADRRDATFRVVKGLANSGCYSFATADGGYLRHRSFLLRAEPDDGTPLFRQDATFCPRPSPYPGATMLESVNYPGRFLRHQNFQLKLAPYQNTDLYWADSAFTLVDGLG
ncbi:AbfB domain-containing protein [Streptomyces sp. NPDC046942]|uniref:AbfB domain-containing protein n=1 Tax=Streptomyces sp. NPDC046942 TaxID=3155137 RepID=UPI0033FF3360